LSSKLRKLKQQAYEAGKKRDWTAAMDAYAQILEFDKNNPSLLNEYGDVCLKAGDTAKALRQFLSAASRYKSTGLLNNAQAVYKKVLRHDPDNLNANWFLAEVRASQGLLVDGEHHALRFLAAADEVSGEIKEIFLKRCVELLSLYPGSDALLDRLNGIFRLWELPLEAARAGVLRACLLHAAGEPDLAAQAVSDLVAAVPELTNYPEFQQWRQAVGDVRTPAATADVNTIDLDGPAPAPAQDLAPAEPTPSPQEPEVEVEESTATDADETSFAGLAPALASEDPEPSDPDERSLHWSDDADEAAPDDDTPDDDGCIVIDDDATDGFASLMDDLAGLANEAAASLDQPAPAALQPEELDRCAGGSVNLLAEILAEEGEDILRSSETEQLSTIASEIGRNVGESQEADPEAQYQQGLVYLELGMHDQAALALASAANDPAHAMQAREMWGIALQRSGQLDEALAVVTAGLAGCRNDDRPALGLRYHAGCILQELGRMDEAQECFRLVHQVDAGFADVARRLRLQHI